MNIVRKADKRPAVRERVPGLDLLRIVCMMMIVCSHFLIHGKVLKSLGPADVNYYVGWMVEACCFVMVDCFVLVTGYFQSTSSFKLKKLLLLWGQIDFTSAVVYLVLCAADRIVFSWDGFFSAAAAVTGRRYWFATAYLILYAVSPLLNRAMENLTQREHFTACAILLGVFVLGRNVVWWKDFAALRGGYGYVSFVVLYVTAAYLRKYPPKPRKWLLPYFLLSALTGLSYVILDTLSRRFGFPHQYVYVFLQYNSATVVAASVCFFLFFLNLEIDGRFSRGLIGFFAPLAFGVYLVHDQPDARALLWPWLNPSASARSPFLFLLLPATVLSVFLACSLADFARRKLSGLCRIPAFAGKAADAMERTARFVLNRFLPPERPSELEERRTDRRSRSPDSSPPADGSESARDPSLFPVVVVEFRSTSVQNR